MTVQISIIGLGKIGASIGLALADHKDQLVRVGHDRQPGVAQKARKLGAVDTFHYSLPAAAAEADILFLALPVDQIRETLAVIAPELREDAVVMDTAPAKAAVAGWVKELLPPHRHYVGLVPVINARYLPETGTGIDAAHADLFRRGLIAIVSPHGTVSEAVKLAADLAVFLGSQPLFADLTEVDGILAAIHVLPQLCAAALLDATLSQPGWSDSRKLTGRVYAESTAAILNQDEPAALRDAALLNRANTVRMLDSMIAALTSLRDEIYTQEKDALSARLERARQGRIQWWKERTAGDWLSVEFGKPEMPKQSDFWKRLLTGDRGDRSEDKK